MTMIMSFTKLVTKISSKCPLLLVEWVFIGFFGILQVNYMSHWDISWQKQSIRQIWTDKKKKGDTCWYPPPPFPKIDKYTERHHQAHSLKKEQYLQSRWQHGKKSFSFKCSSSTDDDAAKRKERTTKGVISSSAAALLGHHHRHHHPQKNNSIEKERITTMMNIIFHVMSWFTSLCNPKKG